MQGLLVSFDLPEPIGCGEWTSDLDNKERVFYLSGWGGRGSE